MATPTTGAKIKQFSQSLVDFITGNLGLEQARGPAGKSLTPASAADDALAREAFNPDNAWFPTGTPIQPVAPEGSTTGRRFNVPPFVNLSYVPRSESGENAVDFKTLRMMSDPAQGGLDLLRLAIETRKDQMAAQRWAIRGKEKDDDGGEDARRLELLLEKPDGVHDFHLWMRMLIEEHLVTDAPAIYFNTMGKRPVFEQIDGATLHLLVTARDGRTPLPPLPAFQQVLYGLPAENYTLEEIGYYPYNKRVHRIYGYSRVEQVITIVNIALNRQLSQLTYYTEGTVPDAICSVPDEWTQEQIQVWEAWWNSILSGQIGEKRKVRFVPGKMDYKETKADLNKNEFDEWLARIICYCFSLSPQALVKQMNRATANTAKQQAEEEGLSPLKLWFKSLMDDIIARVGLGELEFYWLDEEIVDPKTQAEVTLMLYGGTAGTAKPIITLDEARERMGYPPPTADQLEELQPPAPEPDPAQAGDPSQNGQGKQNGAATKKKDPQTAKIAAVGRSLRSLPRDADWFDERERAFAQAALSALREQQAECLAAVRSVQKAAGPIDALRDVLRRIGKGQIAWNDKTRGHIRDLVEEITVDRFGAAIDQVGQVAGIDRDIDELLAQGNEDAVVFAEARVGNLITQVNATTRDTVNEYVAAAIEEGLSNEQLAELLTDTFAFSEERAVLIARTELATAETQGTLDGYRASGAVEQKEWSADADACDECAEIDGTVVGIDEDFPGGAGGPPLHPNCRCSILPVITSGAAT